MSCGVCIFPFPISDFNTTHRSLDPTKYCKSCCEILMETVFHRSWIFTRKIVTTLTWFSLKTSWSSSLAKNPKVKTECHKISFMKRNFNLIPSQRVLKTICLLFHNFLFPLLSHNCGWLDSFALLWTLPLDPSGLWQVNFQNSFILFCC